MLKLMQSQSVDRTRLPVKFDREQLQSLEKDELIDKVLSLQSSLIDHEKIFNTILEYSLSGYWDWYIKEDYEYMSPSFKAMFGYLDKEVPNHPSWWQQHIHPDDLPGVFEVFNAHVESHGEIPYNNEVRYFHKDGRVVWVYCRGKVIEWDEDGSPVRMVGSHVDITPLKTVQEKLKLCLDSGSIGTWDWNITENNIEWDDHMYSLYGLDVSDFGSAYEAWLASIHPDDEKHVDKEVAAALAGLRNFNTLFRVLTTEKEVRYIRATGIVFKNHDGAANRMMGLNWDVTKEKESEQTIIEINQELQNKNQELQNLAYITSHDLREPINTMIAFSDMLMDVYSGSLDDTAREWLNHINRAGNRGAQLITDILEYSRLGVKKELEEVDLNDLLADVQDDLRLVIDKSSSSISIDKLPAMNIYRTELRLLFQNLLSNAMKFVAEGTTPEINIKVSAKNDFVHFEISDNGIGIDQKNFEKIFSVFGRAHSRSDYEGTGIGLAHVKKVVEMHGGEIDVHSQVGQGSTFNFSISKTLG